MIKVYRFCFYDFFVGNIVYFDNYLFLLDVMYSKYLLGVFIKKYIFFVWRFFIYIMIDFVFYNCYFFSIYFIDKIFIGN